MTLLQRIKAPVPRFFKRVQYGGFLLVVGSFVLLLLPAGPVLRAATSHLCVAGVVAVLLAQVSVGGKDHQLKRHGRFASQRRR